MNSIIISIQPEYCELIASGKKTIEVRKTAPKAPFRAFIYQTKKKWIYRLLEWLGLYQQKVIGEFVCEKVTKYEDINLSHFEFARVANGVDKYPIEENSCLTLKQMQEYGKGKDLYFLHITALKIYDKPKELSDFKHCDNKCRMGYSRCGTLCKWYDNDCKFRKITHPPQSWQYIETPDWAEEDKI